MTSPRPSVENEELANMERRKDAAYEERNRVVAALAKRFPSGITRTAIEGWSEDWHGCVYIDLPTGQASWHFHDSHAHLFDGLPPYTKPWDGHDTEEKYRRLALLRSATGGGEREEIAHRLLDALDEDSDRWVAIADELRGKISQAAGTPERQPGQPLTTDSSPVSGEENGATSTGGGERDCAHTVWAWNAEKNRHVCAHCGADREGQFEPLSTPPSASPAGEVDREVCDHGISVDRWCCLCAEANGIERQSSEVELGAIALDIRRAVLAAGEWQKRCAELYDQLTTERAARAELETLRPIGGLRRERRVLLYWTDAECTVGTLADALHFRDTFAGWTPLPKVVLANQEKPT